MADIPEAELANIKDIFDNWDGNKDGVIQKEEIGDAIRAAGRNPSEAEISQFMQEVDENKDGVVDLDEFIRMITVLGKDNEAALKEAFSFFDKDKNGKISAKELQQVLTSYGEVLSEEEAAEIVTLGDMDGDGLLNIDEFVRVLQSFD